MHLKERFAMQVHASTSTPSSHHDVATRTSCSTRPSSANCCRDLSLRARPKNDRQSHTHDCKSTKATRQWRERWGRTGEQGQHGLRVLVTAERRLEGRSDAVSEVDACENIAPEIVFRVLIFDLVGRRGPAGWLLEQSGGDGGRGHAARRLPRVIIG